MTAFVLVHGTTQSPAGWERVRAELDRHGRTSVAVDLPADQPELEVAGYARLAAGQAAEQLAASADEVVVVAHSGSGLLLPAIADALGAAAMVWLAAYIPDFVRGRSLFEEVQGDPAALFDESWVGVDPVGDPDAARRFLFHDADPEVGEWALTTLRSFVPAAAYRHHPLVHRPTIGSTCVVPTADRTLRPEWMRRAALDRLGVTPIELDAGHCPQVSRPEAVAGLLTAVA